MGKPQGSSKLTAMIDSDEMMSAQSFTLRTFLLCLVIPLLASAADKKELDVSASQAWTDTSIDLKQGDLLTFTATGTINYENGKPASPDGLSRGWTDLVTPLPVNGSGRGALVGRISDDPAARPFLIGSHLQLPVPVAGRLFLGINQMKELPGNGSFHVVIERTAAQASKVNPTDVPVTPLTQQQLDGVPTRVNDAENNLGDRVNFILVGSQEKVQSALAAAGWVAVDKTHGEAVLRGLVSSLSKQAYVTVPMSELMLFGRVQDFGYAQADPVIVAASRHHFRIWKAPFAVGDQTVWAGAGTHDIGFEKDQRNNGITHKIDPATDGERDYIGKSLELTGMVIKEDYMKSTNPVTEARTATGGGFTSDGRTLVIYLKP
jgi:hypothetical protein